MMSIRLPVFFMTLLLLPAVAAAQTPPPRVPAVPAMQSPSPQMRADMQRFRDEMRAQMASLRRLHDATRAKMLAALSPAHRAAVARIVGDLAVSPSPDPRSAARQIDALLSSAERSAILADSRSEMTKMRALMERMRSRMHAQFGALHGAMMRAHSRMRAWHERHRHRRPDAGSALLFGLAPGGGMPQ
ncbi:MAG: hypothetical protein ACREMP_08900 [Candidatus Tyrphobacter sp.]